MKNYIVKASAYTFPNIFRVSFKRPKGEDLLLKVSLLSLPFFLRGFYWFGIGIPPYFSPAYLILPITVALFAKDFLKDDRTSYLSIALLSYQAFALALLFIQSSLFGLTYGIPNEIGRIVFPPTYFFIYYTILKRFGSQKTSEYLIYFIKAGVVLMAIETAIRYFIIAPRMVGITAGIYIYKPSLFFMDSNFTGFILTAFLSLAYFYRFHFQRRVFRYDVFIIFILILLSMSRASIFAAVVIFFYAYFLKVSKAKKIAIIALGISALIMVLPLILEDGSFKSKLKIVEHFSDWLNSSTDHLLLGIGSGNMSLTYDMGSHNLIGLTIELGFVWLAVYLGVFTFALYYVGTPSIWLLLPTFIAGTISLYPITYTGVMFVGFVFMILLKDQAPEKHL